MFALQLGRVDKLNHHKCGIFIKFMLLYVKGNCKISLFIATLPAFLDLNFSLDKDVFVSEIQPINQLKLYVACVSDLGYNSGFETYRKSAHTEKTLRS